MLAEPDRPSICIGEYVRFEHHAAQLARPGMSEDDDVRIPGFGERTFVQQVILPIAGPTEHRVPQLHSRYFDWRNGSPGTPGEEDHKSYRQSCWDADQSHEADKKAQKLREVVFVDLRRPCAYLTRCGHSHAIRIGSHRRQRTSAYALRR